MVSTYVFIFYESKNRQNIVVVTSYTCLWYAMSYKALKRTAHGPLATHPYYIKCTIAVIITLLFNINTNSEQIL